MTVSEALNVSDRSVSRRDAEVLLAFALGKDRAWLAAHSDESLTKDQSEAYQLFLSRRERNEPVAYITGVKEFYGRPFACDARALIPRPETEAIIDRIVTSTTAKPTPYKILELGTGSGNISITLNLELAAHSIPAHITATDIAPEPLALAQENAERLGAVSDLSFVVSDMFSAPTISENAPYDLIVANLPYVADTWKFDPSAQPDVIFFEPDVALFGGGEDGLNLYRQFWKDAPNFLNEDGRIIIEYGEDQTEKMLPLIEEAFPTKQIQVYKDYAGLDRVIEIR